MTSSPSPQEALTLLYRQASLHSHPDRGGTTELMLRVNAAAEVLRGHATVVQSVRVDCAKKHCPRHAPSDNHTFRSGKNVGKSLDEISLSSLAWYADNSESDHFREMCLDWLHYRTAGLIADLSW